MVQAAPPPPLKRLSRFLQTNGPGTLASLLAEVHKLRELDATLKSALNQPLRSKLRVAALHDRTLVIHADSPVWAARARYASRKILRNFNKLNSSTRIQSIRVRVSPAEPGEVPRAKTRSMSAATAECLRAAAAGIQDSAVRTALLRLADNVED
jgi:hypothetical protein